MNLRNSPIKNVLVFVLSIFVVTISFTALQAQTAGARGTSTEKKATIYVDIQNSAIKNVIVVNNKTLAVAAPKVDIPSNETVVYIEVELEPGENLFSVNGSDGSSLITVNRQIRIIYKPVGTEQAISIQTKPTEVTEKKYKFKILPPTNIDKTVKEYSIETKKDGDAPVKTTADIKRGPDDKAIEMELTVELKEGKNTITVAAVGAKQLTFDVVCTKPCQDIEKLVITAPKGASKESATIHSERELILAVTPPKNLKQDTEITFTASVKNDALKFEEETKLKVKTGGSSPEDSKIPVQLRPGLNSIKVSTETEGEGGVTKRYEGVGYVRCENGCGELETHQGLNTRLIVGFEQVGASSAVSTTQPFINFFANVPIINRSKPDGSSKSFWNGRPISLWTDFRLTASSVQSFASLGNISAGLINQFSGQNTSINNVVKSFTATGGVDVTLIREGKTLLPFFIPGKSSLSWIAGAGITTPLSPRETIQVFTVPKVTGNPMLATPEFRAIFGDGFNTKTNIAFVSGDRDRFFRKIFTGFRLKVNPFANEETRLNQPSGMFDFTVGWDESITRTLSGPVFSFDGFTPIKVGKYDFIYLFAGANLRLTRKVNDSAPGLFLEFASSPNLTNGSTGLFDLSKSDFLRSNRDVFRFGIGVDLMRLFKKPVTP